MSILNNDETTWFDVNDRIKRKVMHRDQLTTAVVQFTGSQTEPDPPHSHPHEQITYVAEGELFVFLGEDKTRIKKGDMFSVPPNLPHSVQILSDSATLIDSFSPVREDFK